MDTQQNTGKELRILVVEDEAVTLGMLCEALRDMGFTVAGDAMNFAEAQEVLATTQVDLAILDINLRGKQSGIDLGRHINERYGIPFIYLTAYSDVDTINAATATSPYGYLIKPFSPADISAAIQVAIAQRVKTNGPDIFLRDQNNFIRLQINEIHYVEACRNYLEIHTGRDKHVIRSTMKEMAARLPADLFFMPHRSYLVNRKHVRGYRNGNLQTAGGDSVPVSSGRQKAVLRLFST